MAISLYEQETIINFNKEDKDASIYTYEKTWQLRLEKGLGLKPVLDDGHGGKEYKIDKKRIKMPRAPIVVSATQKKILGERLLKARLSSRKP